MHRLVATVAAAAAIFVLVESADAKYPVLSLFTRTADGPYQPQARRYIVVDPIPSGPAAPGHAAPHGHLAADDAQLWRRHDLTAPAYPYGWFGARHSNERQTRGSYYDDYENVSVLRGR